MKNRKHMIDMRKERKKEKKERKKERKKEVVNQNDNNGKVFPINEE